MEWENRLIKRVIREIGLLINKDNYLIDQETGQFIMIDNKLARFSFSEFIGTSPNELFLCPLVNPKHADGLLRYSLCKANLITGIYFHSYHLDNFEKNTVVLRNNTMTLRTESYDNPCLAYLEALFLVWGEKVNFLEYDSKLTKR